MLYIVIAIMLLLSANINAEDSWEKVFHPSLEVKKLIGKIDIDGNLDDNGWRDASKVNKFHEHYPGDQTQPPVNTIAMITYDETSLYVGFMCYDNPEDIRATLCERDKMVWDDNVIFALDTYGDAAWAYEIGANPYGIQFDAIWSRNGGEDSSYDLIFESAGAITDSGYAVEMAIPFASLRLPRKDVQTFKADFWRNYPRDQRHQMSWPAYDRGEPCWPCQWGTLTGIEGVESGHGLELLSSVIGSQSGAMRLDEETGQDFFNDDVDFEASVGVKYSISSNVTAEATVNPDFSQVESDAAQIDVNSTFALFYPEKRPFFQEGSDLFSTWFNAVYTRQINDPLFAGKMIGRLDKVHLAFLTAYDEHSPVIIPFEEQSAYLLNGKSASNIFRARYNIGDETHIGGLITDRRYIDGGSGSVVSVDGLIKPHKNYQIELQYLVTHTKEPVDTSLTSELNDHYFDNGKYTGGFDGESFWGHGIYASFERHARTWWFDFDYTEISPTFRAENGFENSNNGRFFTFSSGLELFTGSDIFVKIMPYFDIGRKWNFSNERKDEWIHNELGFNLPGQTYFETGFMVSREKFKEVVFPDIRKQHVYVSSKFTHALSLELYAHRGNLIARRQFPKPVMGEETYISFSADIRPFYNVVCSPAIEYIKSDSTRTGGNIFEGYTARVRFDYQATRELNFRLITQYDDFDEVWEFDPLVTYRINPFTMCYLGSTHDFAEYDTKSGRELNHSSRQFFFKIQYLFQR